MELRPIPGYRRYAVSQDGSIVQNRATLKPLKLSRDKHGNTCVSLMKDDNKPTKLVVAKLVRLAWPGENQLPDGAVPIPGYEPYYALANGEIYSAFEGPTGPVRKLKTSNLTIHGYPYVTLYGKTPVAVHKLILLAFVGPRPSTRHECRHLNGIRTDNRKDNLEWGTKKENAADKHAHGTTIRGTRFWSAVLSEVDVREMRRLHTEEKMTFSALALRFNINKVTARCACLRLTWKHVL